VKRFRRSLRRRIGQRGAVAVEFAFALFFLIPLLLGMLDYGYYFWIGVNAVQAANAGLLAATNASPKMTTCDNTAASLAAQAAASAAASAAVTNQMNLGLPAGFAAATTTFVNQCTVGPPNPIWTIQVQVDFVPVVGFLNPWMPPSATQGSVRFRSPKLAGSP
jgi:Flp pilus assembly protein TadG